MKTMKNKDGKQNKRSLATTESRSSGRIASAISSTSRSSKAPSFTFALCALILGEIRKRSGH